MEMLEYQELIYSLFNRGWIESFALLGIVCEQFYGWSDPVSKFGIHSRFDKGVE